MAPLANPVWQTSAQLLLRRQFGRKVQPGQLIHADKHGFLVVPAEDEARLLEAAMFMDNQ